MRTALVCVRTPMAAQSIMSAAQRLGVANLRTAVSASEALARLGEHPAELVLVDTAITHSDPAGFTRRALALAPRAVVVLFGHEEPPAAAAAVAAGARGVIRGGDYDVVGTVTKALLLIGAQRPVPAGAPAAAKPTASLAPLDRSDAAKPTASLAPLDRSDAAKPTASLAPLDRSDAATPTASLAPLDRSDAATPTASLAPLDRSDANGSVDLPAGEPAAERIARELAARPAGTVPAASPAPAPAGGGTVVVPAQRGDLPGAAEAPFRHAALTERELQVLQGMASGKSNAEIGRDLYVSEDTVKTHARRLFRKLKARDRAHAVAVGFRSGALP